MQKLYFLTSKCKKNEKWFCSHPDLNLGSIGCENGALDHLDIETINNVRAILSNKYSFYFWSQFLRPQYVLVLGRNNFLDHLFYLLYAKLLGNSIHIVLTCNISRIFSCFLSSSLMSTYSKVIFWLPKIWALGSWNEKIKWNLCLPITLDCFKLKNKNQFWLSDLVVPRSSLLYWELTLSVV